GLDDRGEGDENELRGTTQPSGEEVGDLDIESNELIGIIGVGLDLGRAAFGIACPAERLWGGLRRGPRGRHGEENDRGEQRLTNARSRSGHERVESIVDCSPHAGEERGYL